MIEINNLTATPINDDFLKKVAERILKEEKREADLSIALVGLNRIRELNKKYRKKDKITDVLSFKYNHSGEVVICPQEVKKDAERLKSAFKKELARVLIHGTLHLLGYDHEKSKKKAQKMTEKENYYLNLVFP